MVASASDKRLTVADLSPDQKRVHAGMMDWCGREVGAYGSEAVLKVGGLAGSGKTTLLGVFARDVKDASPMAFVSYTGRASSILGRKLRAAGVETTDLMCTDSDKVLDGRYGHLFCASGSRESRLPFCGTLHKLLYRPVIDPRTDELTGWAKRDRLDRRYRLLVVDEASMVGDDMLGDLQRHGVPILAVGDHGQLPPVMAKGSLMESPDLTLEKIHRQAAGSPIIRLAHKIRSGAGLMGGAATGDRALVYENKSNFTKVYEAAVKKSAGLLDVAVVCWTNKTRTHLNGVCREILKRPEDVFIEEGETLICLRNYPEERVFNGMRGVAQKAGAVDNEEPWTLNTRVGFPEEGIAPCLFGICIPQLGREKTYASVEEMVADEMPIERVKDGGHLFDYGYAMTCHKMQGSGFPHVIVYMDRPEAPWDEEWRRWAYTAFTRASERLTVLT